MKKVISHSEKETKDLGRRLGRACCGGEIFALSGDLGVGKTKFIQGLAAGLGIKRRVNSPTFNIWKIYKIRNNRVAVKNPVKIFCHLDAYRLGSAKDLISLGVEEYFFRPDTVVAIEWAERVRGIWPKGTKTITIERRSSKERGIKIK